MLNKKLSKFNDSFYILSRLMPRKTLLNICNSIVISTLTQDVIIWSKISEIHKTEIQIFQFFM